tara:strand:- start:1690 stop:2217 length:528 start_codon:yes stop_codon:yes gene_type:complete
MFNKLTDDHRKLLTDMKNKNKSAGEIASFRASLMRGYSVQQANEKLKTLGERQSKKKKEVAIQEPQIVNVLPIPDMSKPKRQAKPKQPVEPQFVEQVATVQEPKAKPKPRAKKQPLEPAPVAPVAPVQEPKAKPKARGKKQQEPPLAPVAEETVQEPKPKARRGKKGDNQVELIF